MIRNKIVVDVITIGLLIAFFGGLVSFVGYLGKGNIENYCRYATAYEQQKLDYLIMCISYDNRDKHENVKVIEYKEPEETKNQSSEDFFKGLSKNPKVSALFQKYFPEVEIAKTMRAISLSESKGKQIVWFKQNKNGSWDCGFFQTNTIHKEKGESYEAFCKRMNTDLEANFAKARQIYEEREKIFGDGFTAWSDYNNGKYLTYLK